MLNFEPIISTLFKAALPIATISNLGLYAIFLKTDTNTIVDFGWAFNQWLIGGYLFSRSMSPVNAVSFAILSIWASRLGGTLLINRVIKGENDPRYERMAQKSFLKNRNLYFWFQFVLQGILVTVPAIPLYYLFRPGTTFGLNYIIGSVMALSGISLAHKADSQLNEYKESHKHEDKKPKGLFRGGLWAKSRHPNLFFDVVTWTGFALMACNSLNALPAFLGPISLFNIMYFITIPITESHMRKSRPNWHEMIEGTNVMLPF